MRRYDEKRGSGRFDFHYASSALMEHCLKWIFCKTQSNSLTGCLSIIFIDFQRLIVYLEIAFSNPGYLFSELVSGMMWFCSREQKNLRSVD